MVARPPNRPCQSPWQFTAVALVTAMATLANQAKAEPLNWKHSGGALFATQAPAGSGHAKILETGELSSPNGVEPQQTSPEISGDPSPRLLPSRQPLNDLVSSVAAETGLDPKLLHALIIVESGYKVRAVSPVGAQGLTQLMPGTAAELGVEDAFEPEANLRGGARYLATQIGRFGDVRLALAAYNAGPARVARLGRVPAISETQIYVRDAVDCYLALTAGRGIRTRSQCKPRGGH